jgi:hypothetical protein
LGAVKQFFKEAENELPAHSKMLVDPRLQSFTAALDSSRTFPSVFLFGEFAPAEASEGFGMTAMSDGALLDTFYPWVEAATDHEAALRGWSGSRSNKRAFSLAPETRKLLALSSLSLSRRDLVTLKFTRM